MNLAQIRSAVRDYLTAGSGVNTNIAADTFWATQEINGYINEAVRGIYKAMRRARADYFVRIMRTTDSAFNTGFNQLFDPDTLKWVAGTGNYTLPNDFMRMKLITDLSTDRIRLIKSDIAKNEFRILMMEDGGNTAREYLYDILGVRTLLIRPVPQEEREFEFIYERLLPRLKDYSTGTATVVQDDATVEFSVSADATRNIAVGDEIILSSSSTAPTADPSETYYPVASITDATHIELARPYQGSNLSGVAYISSMVPEVPDQHHDLIIARAVLEGFRKGTNPSSDAVELWSAKVNEMLMDLINDVEIRADEAESVQAYLEDLYGD